MTDISEILKDRSAKWTDIEELDARTDKWLYTVREKKLKEEYEILLNLLSNFNYYSHKEISIICRDLYRKFSVKEKTYLNSLYIPVISKDGTLNHSFEILTQYIDSNNLHRNYAWPDIWRASFQRKFNKSKIFNIVLVDDMSGSGNTIINCLEILIKSYEWIFNDRRLYIMLIEITDEAKNKINKFANDNGLKIEDFIIHNQHKKAFDSQAIFYTEESKERAKHLIKEIESKFSIGSDYILGYKDSQCLIAFHYNTPNNTLPIFWCEDKGFPWTPLFPRRKGLKPPFEENTFVQKRKRKENSMKFKGGK
jgi:hypothetical protein